MQLRAFVLAVGVLVAPSTYGAEAPRMTLVDALRFALRKAPELSIATAQEENADDAVANAVSKFLPSLDAQGSLGAEERKPEASRTAPWTSAATISLTENLYDNGTSLIEWRRSKVQRQLSTLQREQARDTLLLNVASAFHTYTLSERLLAVRLEQRDLADKQFLTVQTLFRQGLRTKRDYLRFRAQWQRAEIDVRSARIAAEQRLAELTAAMGAAPTDDLHFEVADLNVDPQKIPVVPVDAKKTFDYRVADARYRLTPFSRDLAERQYWPTIALGLGATYGSNGFVGRGAQWANGENSVLFGQLTLTYNIWDWGLRRRNVAIAERNVFVGAEQLRRAELDAGRDTKKLALQLDQLRNTLVLSAELVDANTEVYGYLKNDYAEGKVAPFDVIQGFRDLLDARVSLLSARTDATIGLLRYRFQEGVLSDQFPLARGEGS